MQAKTTSATVSPPPLSQVHEKRIHGLDLARALALLGMIVVHFELATGATGSGPSWLGTLTGALQGRAAAVFVVLAGIGASLGSTGARASEDRTIRRSARWTLARRGVFLLVAGCLFLPVWEADILHSYGVWLMAGAGLLFAPTAWLLGVALLAVVGNALVLLYGDFFAHWNLFDLTYRGLWTPVGFVRNLFIDGWNPVLPWLGLYLYGMVLGRLDLRSPAVRGRLTIASAVALALTLLAAHAWAPPLLWSIEPGHLFMTTALPPTPGFVGLGAAVATLVIIASCVFAERFPRLSAPWAATGQLALTLYIGHVIIGLGTLEELNRLGGQTLPFAVGSALTFFALAMIGSWAWRAKFRRGPLEALMRAVS